jgi:uncharacterized membrane protein YgcG
MDMLTPTHSWKILFVLQLLVYATLASFFFPGDTDGVAVRVSISSTMFLALCGLLNVASETLPKLEYLTDCDKLIMLSAVIVFLVNVWNCILLLVWNSTGEFVGGDAPGDTAAAEPGYFENVAWFGVPGSAAAIHPEPFQQTCPKMSTLRLPYHGFWGSFWRSFFGALMPHLDGHHERRAAGRGGAGGRGAGGDGGRGGGDSGDGGGSGGQPWQPGSGLVDDGEDLTFAVPSEEDNCAAFQLDENFAWLLGIVYRAFQPDTPVMPVMPTAASPPATYNCN